jgi:hypothetical protein
MAVGVLRVRRYRDGGESTVPAITHRWGCDVSQVTLVTCYIAKVNCDEKEGRRVVIDCLEL